MAAPATNGVRAATKVVGAAAKAIPRATVPHPHHADHAHHARNAHHGGWGGWGRTGEHGWQLDAVARVEQAGGEGDADDVVAEGPHEVEPDAAHHHAREVEGRRHLTGR